MLMPAESFELFQLFHTGWMSVTQLLMLLALCGLRLLVVFLMLPAMSTETVPGVARNGVLYLLVAFVAFGQPVAIVADLDAVALIKLCAKEAFIGLLLGYAAASIFWIAEAIGITIDNLSGYNNVQMVNPLRGDSSTPVGATMLQFTITLFYLLGGMTALLATIFESYRWWPLTQMGPDLTGLAESFFLQQTDSMFTLIVKLACPVMLVLVLIDLGFGLLARAADKLEPASLSVPVRGAVTLLMLVLLAATFVEQVRPQLAFSGFLDAMRVAIDPPSTP